MESTLLAHRVMPMPVSHAECATPAGDFLKHHFDDWLDNSTMHDPEFSTPWAEKDPRAVGRYTNFPTGKRALSKRGQASLAAQPSAVSII